MFPMVLLVSAPISAIGQVFLGIPLRALLLRYGILSRWTLSLAGAATGGSLFATILAMKPGFENFITAVVFGSSVSFTVAYMYATATGVASTSSPKRVERNSGKSAA